MVNFNNFQINNTISLKPKIMQTQPARQFSLTQTGLSFDTFVKSAANNANVSLWNEERLKAIYDETYEDIVAQNPIVNKLNIQKPVFVFKQDPNDTKEKVNFAAYSFLNNSIEMTSNLFENMYAIGIKDKDGNLAKFFNICTQSVLDEDFEQTKKLEPDLEAIQLTDSEKEFRIKGIIAHELRHWIQEHLLLSNENTKDSYSKHLQQICSDMEAVLDGVDLSQVSEEDRFSIDTSYFKNYKPKEILKDKYLKLSRLPKDNRYWSIKEHILKSASDNGYNDNYFALPNEADANYCAFEYLVSKIPKTYSNKTREDILTSIIMYYEDAANTAILDMSKCGYPQIEILRK